MNMEFKNLLSFILKQQITECYKYRKPAHNFKKDTEIHMNKVELEAINNIVNSDILSELNTGDGNKSMDSAIADIKAKGAEGNQGKPVAQNSQAAQRPGEARPAKLPRVGQFGDRLYMDIFFSTTCNGTIIRLLGIIDDATLLHVVVRIASRSAAAATRHDTWTRTTANTKGSRW